MQKYANHHWIVIGLLDRGRSCWKYSDCRLCGLVLREVNPTFLFIPKVDTGLITDLDWSSKSAKYLVASLNNGILCLPGDVVLVEIDQVIVGNTTSLRMLPS